MNVMIINYNNEQHLHTCPCCFNIEEGSIDPNKVIPIYYSTQEAENNNWFYTNSPDFCPPEMKGVWICPDCFKEALSEGYIIGGKR